ncbi:MAG: sigma-70 family RNA polymerase sigma factor [Deltaproteobacteria bacterium]|nr:sigma-70 family RNA polymerase sigma factor [Deltaproteobacteria bacterium]
MREASLAGRPVSGRVGARAVALTAVLLGAAPASADPVASVRLEFTRAEGAETCPDEIDLRRGVVARLGRDPFTAAGPRVIRVTISRGAAGLSGRVVALNAEGRIAGERVIASRRLDCGELAASLALALAIAIDPLAAARNPADTWDAASQPASVPQGGGTGPDVGTPAGAARPGVGQSQPASRAGPRRTSKTSRTTSSWRSTGTHEFDPGRPVRPWLFGFAYRVASDHRRRAQVRREVLDGSPDRIDGAPSAEDRVTTTEARQIVLAGLEALSLEARAVRVLRLLEQLATAWRQKPGGREGDACRPRRRRS